jgi:hypothetical protein
MYTEAHGGHWIALGYEEAHEIAIDPITFSSNHGVSFPPIPYPPAPPVEFDPPLHKQFRVPMLDRFSPRAVAAYEPFYRQTMAELLEPVLERGEIEVVSQLLQPMTGRIAANFLGAPDEDMRQLSDWAAQFMTGGVDGSAEVMPKIVGYFTGMYHDRKAHPVDDIPTLMISLKIDGEPMSENDFVLMMTNIFNGALDSTVSAAAYMFEWLAGHPDERKRLAADHQLIPTAVEEFLRHFVPFMALRRVATRDREISGQTIRKGETVLLHWLAANHDPAEFEDPEELMLDRHPNRHFTFGVGIHRCLGSNVARQELRILLEEVLDRIGDWELDPDRPAVRYQGVTRGVRELWLRFEPSASRA